MRKVWLYAIDKMHNIVDTAYLCGDSISIRGIKNTADWMANRIPSDLKIYAIDDRYGLYFEFREARIPNNYAQQIQFEDMLNTDGFRVK